MKIIKIFFFKIQPTPVEEPPLAGGKEKRKRKLDEIVFGLSAAKEQKTFSDPLLSSPSSKKAQIPPSVSVTPASGPSSMGNQSSAAQKPFSVTVTSVPGSNTRKSFFNLFVMHGFCLNPSKYVFQLKISFLNFFNRIIEKCIKSRQCWWSCCFAKYDDGLGCTKRSWKWQQQPWIARTISQRHLGTVPNILQGTTKITSTITSSATQNI